MDSRFRKNAYINSSNEQEDDNTDQENMAESPPSDIDGSLTSPTSSKRRRGLQKRVVQIPMKESDQGSRLKGENHTPPSDSWTWRKYGQKPIKGSPYPRGYYRCSSSKGCPARKQVERSRVDPTMIVVTYSSEHNHPWPLSRNHHSRYTIKKPQPDPEENFTGLAGDNELGWFGEMETTSPAMLESPIMADYDAADVASVLLPMGEEEESLFADLGELPECSMVFRHGLLDDRRRFTAPCCGTTT